MRHFVGAVLILATTAGCSRIAESRFNPGNWFGDDTPQSAEAGPIDVPPLIPTNRTVTQTVDERALVDNLSSLTVQDVSGGALVTAQGRTGRAGGFNIELVPANVDGSTLILDFRVQYPADPVAGSGQPVTAAEFIANKDLRGIRTIVVQAANGSLARSN